MISFSTRTPATIKERKFVECTTALLNLQLLIHKILHKKYKNVLDQPSPVYWINFHALDIENGSGTIRIAVIKSLAHLVELEIQYRVKDNVTEFFGEEVTPIIDWEGIVARLLSAMQ